MKVLHVIPSMEAESGGPSVVMRTIARAQAEQGMEVSVATTGEGGTAPSCRIFPRQTRFYKFSLPLTRWLWKHAGEYDVIHIHALFSYPSVAAAICARRASVPFIVRPLGTLNRWGIEKRRPWLKRLSIRFIEGPILRRAAFVQYTSAQEAQEARDLGIEHRGVVIPNPVDCGDGERLARDRRLKPVLQRTTVLFLSRLDPKKGLDLLLPAFADARKLHPDAVLVVAGDGDLEFVARMKQTAAKLELNGSVTWAGFLEGEAKRAAVSGADVFVLPSYSENFAVAAVEAMGAGVPVIVSDQVGIHREIAAASAGLVVECKVASLARALEQGLADAQWRASAGENAGKLARKFAPEIVAEQLMRLYERVLEKRGQPAAA